MKLFLPLLVLVVLFSAGCTTIKVTDADGGVTIERSFGFASINPGPSAAVFTAEASSFGYISSPLGISVGYSDQTLTTANSECKIVVWVDEKVDQDKLIEELKQLEGVCISK